MRINNRKRNLRVTKKEEDINPMDGMGNLADAMLVFATGIMIALIISWNVSVDEQGAIVPENTLPYDVKDISSEKETIDAKNDNMQELGKVYKDPKTGKLYIIGD